MAERVSGEDNSRKTRVFISYSRRNEKFTERLAEQLVARGYKVDYDRTRFDSDNIDTGISAEDDWWRRLQEMIAACEAMVFVVSPESATSSICDEEISYARTLGKRVIPILLRQIDFSKAPPRLAALNVKLSFEDENAFDASLHALMKALDIDVAWHREGARLMALAAKWDTADRAESLLLPSGAVADAEAWAARRPAQAAAPGELFAAYLAASSAKAKADRDRLLKSTGRAFVRPAEQAFAEGRYDKALRLAAAGILLGEDYDLRLVPELALSAMNAAAMSRWGRVFREGGVSMAKLSPDGKQIVTVTHDGVFCVWDTASGRQLSLLRGDVGLLVSGLALSPDAGRIAYASDDWKARILEAADGRVLAVLQGHERGVADLNFSPDGHRVVTAGFDRTARVWNAAGGKEIAVLKGHGASVVAATFSRDGKRVATASEDNTARVWDASSGRQLAVLRGHSGWVFKAVFSPDGASVATASNDTTARVWKAGGGQLRILRGHGGAVNDIAYSADGSRIATASHDKTARVWDPASGREVALLQGHTNLIQRVSFSPDGARVVTASHDDTARVWDAISGEALCILRGHEGAVESAEFSANGLHVLTASPADGTARLWDSGAAPEIAVLRGHRGSVKAVFGPDGQRILSAGVDGTARIWAADSGRQIALLKHGQGLHSAAFSPDGRLIVTQCYDNKAYVWDAASARRIAVCPERKREILSAAFSPDGARIVTSSRIPTEKGGRTTRVWERSGREVALLRGEYADFSRNGAHIVTLDEDDAIVWDGATYRETGVLRGHANNVWRASFSPDGARIATTSADGTVRLWDVGSAEQIGLADVERPGVGPAFSPDGGSVLIACGANGAVRWDASGRTLVFRGNGAEITGDIGFSPDATRVLAGARDGAARIWDAATGCEIARLRGHEGSVLSASFSPDGERVVTASDDSTVRLWAVGHTRHLLGSVAEVVAAALVGGRGVRAQAERGDLLMQSVEAGDDDLSTALVSRMARSDPDAAARIAARAERLRKPLHPACYVPQSRRQADSLRKR